MLTRGPDYTRRASRSSLRVIPVSFLVITAVLSTVGLVIGWRRLRPLSPPPLWRSQISRLADQTLDIQRDPETDAIALVEGDGESDLLADRLNSGHQAKRQPSLILPALFTLLLNLLIIAVGWFGPVWRCLGAYVGVFRY